MTRGRAISTYRELATAIVGSRPELAVICTPTGSHVLLAREALAGGCRLLVGKPLDVLFIRAVELRVAADQAFTDVGLVRSVMSQYRLDPAVVLLEQAIKGECLGTLDQRAAFCGMVAKPAARRCELLEGEHGPGTAVAPS